MSDATSLEIARFRHLKNIIEWLKTDAGQYFRDEISYIARTKDVTAGITPWGIVPYRVIQEAFAEVPNRKSDFKPDDPSDFLLLPR